MEPRSAQEAEAFLVGLWARWRAFFDAIEAKQKVQAEAEQRRQFEKDREKAHREQYDEYGRPKRQVILSDIQMSLFSILFGGFLLGFGALSSDGCLRGTSSASRLSSGRPSLLATHACQRDNSLRGTPSNASPRR